MAFTGSPEACERGVMWLTLATFVGYAMQFWVPPSMQELFDPGGYKLEDRGARWVESFARLKPGVTREQAETPASTSTPMYPRFQGSARTRVFNPPALRCNCSSRYRRVETVQSTLRPRREPSDVRALRSPQRRLPQRDGRRTFPA